MSLLKFSWLCRTGNLGLVFGGCTDFWSLWSPQCWHEHHWLQAVPVPSQIQGSSLIYTALKAHFSLHRYHGAGLDQPRADLAEETWGQLMGQSCCRRQPRANLRSAAGTSLTPGETNPPGHHYWDKTTTHKARTWLYRKLHHGTAGHKAKKRHTAVVEQ